MGGREGRSSLLERRNSEEDQIIEMSMAKSLIRFTRHLRKGLCLD